MRICTLASGSSGNCYYVGTKDTNILIDAGISGKKVIKGLEEKVGICGQDIDGIFVTHEHSDHIQGLGVLARKFQTPLYATEGTWEGIGNKAGKIAPSLCNVLHNQGSLACGDINLEWFPTFHDANEPIGFLIESENIRVGLVTDSGMIDRRISNTLTNVNLLLLEANHDENMLRNGSYPTYLKKRILSSKGHLSNYAAGQALMDIAGEDTHCVILGHLSQENNLPTIAVKTVEEILKENKIDYSYSLQVAPRSEAGSCINL